jgi:hypothetical protein
VVIGGEDDGRLPQRRADHCDYKDSISVLAHFRESPLLGWTRVITLSASLHRSKCTTCTLIRGKVISL